MGKLITIHSYKGGTGKSYLAVNLAALYAVQGKKVCLLDLDTRAPTLHIVFEPKGVRHWINEVLNGTASVKDCLIDCSGKLEGKGTLHVGFSDFSTDAIREMISKGRRWETDALEKILKMRRELLEDLEFDIIVADTSPGIQYSSINAVVAADVAGVVSTLDESDVSGTAKMLEELYEVFEKKIAIILNKVIGGAAFGEAEKTKVVNDLQGRYKEAVIGVLPCYCEVGRIRRSSIFVLSNPSHPFTEMIRMIAAKLDLF